jgi:hypothetical protein
MRRRLLIALFAFGTIAGYGAGFASMSCRAHQRRANFERHVAHICAEAARNPAAAPRDDTDRPW